MLTTLHRLQESCQRSGSSVRRDRVFERYAEKCGDERVPVLNAASFGKLVRIIFPNVQTRRLGVRGESKYHYVDLSLVVSDRLPPDSRPQSSSARPGSSYNFEGGSKNPPARPTPNLSESPLDTAEFPPPSASFGMPSAELTGRYNLCPPPAKPVTKMHCEKSNGTLLRIPTSKMSAPLIECLPRVRSGLPATLTIYLGLPSSASHLSPSPNTTEAEITLPPIHAYLTGVEYDPPIADSLGSLYRSYCITVIDSFRWCREKPFFHHHAAFNGTMTVPVAKLLALPQLAPWIQECDMRMYKKMIQYIAPLSTQMVPEPVWAVFDRVSTKLVDHLVASFQRKCPAHVVAAKVVPATRFCSLLTKLVRVNQAANNVAPLLSEEMNRSQMWADMVTVVNPERLLDESAPSPECWPVVEKMVRDELRGLLAPLNDEALRPIEMADTTEWAQYFAKSAPSFPSSRENLSPVLSDNNLDRWVQWLECLPQAFEGHHPQCIIDWHTRFWDSVLTQLLLSGAQSFQAWWYLKTFLSNMLSWITQMEGLLLSESDQRHADGIEQEKKDQDEKASSQGAVDTSGDFRSGHTSPTVSNKRKRSNDRGDDDNDDDGKGKRMCSRPPSAGRIGPGQKQRKEVLTTMTPIEQTGSNEARGLGIFPNQDVFATSTSTNVPALDTPNLPKLETNASYEVNGPAYILPTPQQQQSPDDFHSASHSRPGHHHHHHNSHDHFENFDQSDYALHHDDSGIGLDPDIEDSIVSLKSHLAEDGLASSSAPNHPAGVITTTAAAAAAAAAATDRPTTTDCTNESMAATLDQEIIYHEYNNGSKPSNRPAAAASSSSSEPSSSMAKSTINLPPAAPGQIEKQGPAQSLDYHYHQQQQQQQLLTTTSTTTIKKKPMNKAAGSKR